MGQNGDREEEEEEKRQMQLFSRAVQKRRCMYMFEFFKTHDLNYLNTNNKLHDIARKRTAVF